MKNNIYEKILSVYARIERRNDLKAIAKDLYMETTDTNEYISEEKVVPDQCTSHTSTIWFVCAKNKFNCITSTAGKFACTSNRYNDLICQPLAPAKTFECVTTGYATCPPNNQIYECATFNCGIAAIKDSSFTCTNNSDFACNGKTDYDCVNQFSCLSSSAFRCTEKHNCNNNHVCGNGNTGNTSSYICGYGTSEQDKFNCNSVFSCNPGTLSNSSGNFLCTSECEFKCGEPSAVSFDCKTVFRCLKNDGFTCIPNNQFECHATVVCPNSYGNNEEDNNNGE